jgi:hypothetical protein
MSNDGFSASCFLASIMSIAHIKNFKAVDFYRPTLSCSQNVTNWSLNLGSGKVVFAALFLMSFF